jgi:hypothetical protein
VADEVINTGDPDRQRRRDLFRGILPSLGQVLPARLLHKRNSGEQPIHSFAEGIFKPAWSKYALSVVSMLKNPYQDQLIYDDRGNWIINYSPKSGSLESAVNQSLFACLADSEPMLVIEQTNLKQERGGSHYRLVGLGLIERFDSGTWLFVIRALQIDEILSYLDGITARSTPLADDLLETALRLEALEEWSAIVQESRAVYKVDVEKRAAAFRGVVLSNYDFSCSVTAQKFQLGDLVEVEAAHIISVDARGTDDPRNGLSLSRAAHWAFDLGLFTISDQYEVIVHQRAKEAIHNDFRLLEVDRKPIRLPNDSYYHPHPEALEWHRKERFGAFAK